MKGLKKFLASILIAALAIPAMIVLPKTAKEVQASTNGHTQAEAVSWINGKIGTAIDADGAYGVQCVDLIKLYYQYLGQNLGSIGIAANMATVALPSGWTRDKSPRAGDIAVFPTTGSNSTGHVALVTEIVGGQFRAVDYNGTGHNDAGATRTFNTSNASAFIHPDFVSTPDYVNLGDKFYAFIINTKIWKHLTVEPTNNVTIRSEKAGKCPDQVFKFERQSDGSYKITSTANGYCLDVRNASSASGTNVGMCGSNNEPSQRWYILGESGQYKLRAKCTNCLLDVENCNSAEGTNVRMYTANNGDSQKFQIWKWDSRPEAADIGDGFTAPILNTKAWITLENKNGNVILNKEDGTSKQLWKFQRDLDGSYIIFSCLDGKCITSENDSNIGVSEFNNSFAQRWYVYYNGSYFEIKSKETGRMFNVGGGSLTSGANIQAALWEDSDYQKFSIYGGAECKIKAPAFSVKSINESGEVVFSRGEVYGETGFNLKIWKDKIWEGDAFKVIENVKKETAVTLPAGTYQAYVDAYNYYDTKMSDVVTFTVVKSALPIKPTQPTSETVVKPANQKIIKKANPLQVKVTKLTLKRSKLKKAKKISIGVSKAQGKVTYTLNKKAKKAGIKVSKKGKVTIPKNCKKGTYKIKVKAAGNSNYKAGTKTVTIKVK